jgi:hypothetical protein
MILKIFSPKNLAKKLAFKTQKQLVYFKTVGHNIGFQEKRQYFWRKLQKKSLDA